MTTSSSSKNNKTSSEQEPLSFFDESTLTEWFTSNGKYLAYGVCALLVLLILIYRFSATHNDASEQEYLKASNDFMTVIKTGDSTSPGTDATFINFKKLMNNHPELHAIYDGALAQTLLNRGQVEEAIPFAEATLARTRVNHLAFYQDFAETTLLISTKKYEEALKNAIALQDKMNEAINSTENQQERSFSEELFAVNLFRIGMLQQQLNDKLAEQQTWLLWKQYAGLGTNKIALPVHVTSQSFRNVIQQLAIGNISLIDYITYRESILQSQTNK